MSNAAIHLHIARRLKKKGADSQNYLLGNILPDTEFLIKAKEKPSSHKKHYSSSHKKAIFFKHFKNPGLRRGMKIHFLVDDYVHNHYVAQKIKKFKGWNPHLVHFLTETIMDRVLMTNSKKLTGIYDRMVQRINLKRYGKRLEKAFPTRKFHGPSILKDGIEILRISNSISWLKMNKVRKLIQKYSPLKTSSLPNPFKIFYLMKKIEKDVKKELPDFLDKMTKTLRKKINN